MADEYVDARISDLTAADSISDDDLFVLEQSATAKKLPGLVLKNMATNAGSAAGAAAGQAFVQAAEAAADDAQDAAGAAVRAARNAQDILLDVEYEGDIAIVNIEDAADDSLADIAAANTSALSNINAARTAATDAIASEKTEAMAEIDSAVEEVESYAYDIEGLKNLQNEKTVTGTQITVEDAAPVTAKKVLLTLKPKQDLHGYDNPWPAGGNVNLLGLSEVDITQNGINVKTDPNKGTIAVTGTATERTLIAFSPYYTIKANTPYVIKAFDVTGTNLGLISFRMSGFQWGTLAEGAQVGILNSDDFGSAYQIRVNTGGEVNATFKLLLCLASQTPTEWTPYSNICPIEGYTGVNVGRAGKNFIDEDTLYASFKTGTNAFSGTAWAINLTQFNIPQELVGRELTFSAHIASMGATNVRVYAEVGGTGINGNSGTTPFWSSVTFTPTSTSDKVQITFGSSGSGITVFDSVQLEIGSTRTTYEQYQGQKIIANICINQWDEEWRNGYYDSGAFVSNNNYVASKNPRPCNPNTSYFVYTGEPTGRVIIATYDAEMNFIENLYGRNNVVTTSANAKFFNLYLEGSTQTYNHDVSINCPATFTDYFPYTGNDVAYSGTIDLGTGKMVLDKRKSTATSLAGSSPNFYTSVSPVPKTTNQLDILCDKMKTASSVGAEGVYINANTAIMFKTSAYSTASELMEAFGGEVSILYPLASPITIQLTPQQLQMLKGLNYVWTDADDMELAYCYVKDGKSVVVGNAEQLLSKEMTNDQEPYLFRASGGNGADRAYDTLVGGTIAHNQLVQNGNFADGTTGWSDFLRTSTLSASSGILTVTPNNSNNYLGFGKTMNLVLGHKYLFDVTITEMYLGMVTNFEVRNNNFSKSVVVGRNGGIFNCILGGNVEVGISSTNQKDANNVIKCKYFGIYDLTAMFGSTIADYVYSLEQATAGSGIAWLKKYGFFTKPYYPYNAGELMSVKTARHKMVGFNQWDEEWEVGGINDTTGAKITEVNQYRSKNYIPVLPNTNYFFCKLGGNSLWAYAYDKDKNFIQRIVGQSNNIANTIQITPNNCYYILFKAQNTTSPIASYVGDICINLSKTTGTPKNGDYLPYTAYEYPLDPKVTLQGIYKRNGDKLYCDGDRYYPTKGVERHYKLVDLGTLNWAYETTSSVSPYFYTNLPQDAKYYGAFYTTIYPCLCTKYVVTKRNATDFVDKTCCIDGSTGRAGIFEIKDLSYTDAATFKTAMSGVYLVYEIATPYFEPADPFEELQALDPYGTEEYIDDREVPIPVGHDTNYPVNLRAEIERVMKEVPPPPTSNGTYILKVTVASGVPTYSWVAQ